MMNKSDIKITNNKFIGKRDVGADLLRIMLIIMIISHHALVHGLNMSQLSKEACLISPPLVQFVFNSFVVIGVNAFFWISGYFQVHRDIKKIFRLYGLCIIYALVWNIFYVIFKWGDISGRVVFDILFPIRDYWFMAVYFVIILISPYINNEMNCHHIREQFILVLVVTTINVIYGFVFDFVGVGDGYTVIQGINMYIIGRFCHNNISVIKKYLKTWLFLLGYIICSFFIGISTFLLAYKGFSTKAWHLFAYNNPIIIVSSICFCLCFVGKKYKNENVITNMITILGSCCLAAYLITDNKIAKQIIFEPLKITIDLTGNNSVLNVLLIILYAIVLTFVCIFIDILRKKLKYMFKRYI